MARHIKSGDQVMVIAGADKGKQGRVLRVLVGRERVVVEGVNRVWKHVKPSQRNPQGGRIQKDAPIHMSNVMPIDPSTGKATRVRNRRQRWPQASRCGRKRVRLGTDQPEVSSGLAASFATRSFEKRYGERRKRQTG
jgi:large subunit ribosomal protein L24